MLEPMSGVRLVLVSSNVQGLTLPSASFSAFWKFIHCVWCHEAAWLGTGSAGDQHWRVERRARCLRTVAWGSRWPFLAQYAVVLLARRAVRAKKISACPRANDIVLGGARLRFQQCFTGDPVRHVSAWVLARQRRHRRSCRPFQTWLCISAFLQPLCGGFRVAQEPADTPLQKLGVDSFFSGSQRLPSVYLSWLLLLFRNLVVQSFILRVCVQELRRCEKLCLLLQ